jgi:hypothetical protein
MMRLLQDETEDDPGEDGSNSIGTPIIFFVYFLILCMIVLNWCLKRHRSAHHRTVVLALIQQARRDRVYPDFTGAAPEQELDIDVESLALRKHILLEHFRSNGKQMVGADSCICLSRAAVDFRFLHQETPYFFSSQEVAASSFKESSQRHDEDSEGNNVESGLGGDSMLLIVEGESKKSVPICCAICLDVYGVGDSVVWASNDECSHAFHQDCVIEYLAKTNCIEMPCPCCRQNFCNLSESETEVLTLLSMKE